MTVTITDSYGYSVTLTKDLTEFHATDITEDDLTFSGDYYYIQGQTYALNVNGSLALIVQVNAYDSADGSPSDTTSKEDIFLENGPNAVANGIAKLLELYNSGN